MATKIFFTGDNGNVINRSKYLRGALFRNGYSVQKKAPSFKTDNCESIWFHGLSGDNTLSERHIEAMETYNGHLVFFRNDDENSFFPDQIPSLLFRKAALFLRNHWPSQKNMIHPEIFAKSGFINPLLKPLNAAGGMPITKRPIDIVFFGSMSGRHNLPDGSNARMKAIEILHQSKFNFTGGLTRSNIYPPPNHLRVEPVSVTEHNRLLSNSKICLALWGNCPLTYRLFEGFSRRCLVVAQSLESIRFIDCGLKPGLHYVEVKADLSDLIEKIDYYLGNPKTAQEISDAGYEHFIKCFAFKGVNLPQILFEEILQTWGRADGITSKKNLSFLMKNQILKHMKRI